MQLQYINKSLSLLCLLLFLELSVGTMRLCGDSLSDALDKICSKGYNAKLKRSFVPPEYNEVDAAEGALSSFDEWGAQPLLERLLGESLNLVKTRRRRLGISDECCYKGCSYSELASYCRQ